MGNEAYYFETKQLAAGYEGKPVVSNVTMKLKKGEILSLIGPNGSGKTTILKTLIRQLPAVSGAVMIGKNPMEQIHSADLARQQAVVLTERLRTEMMTVEDVVETGRYPYTSKFGILSSRDHHIVSDAMRITRIFHMKNQDFTKISDGQRQRVMLARALAQEPEMILLDEPTSFLDIKYKLEFLTIIRRLSREKKLTVIMSLHEVDLARRISDKIACFRDGILDRIGNPKDIFSDDYVTKLYHIRTEEVDPVFYDVISRI